MVDDASMDLVAASLVLHYLPSWRGVMGEVRRVLKPGGRLVMSVHHPITGWLRSDGVDYHRTELIEEVWDVDGVQATAQMWRRPISDVFMPLIDEGFRVDRVEEPELGLTADDVPDDHLRNALNLSQVFLYVRAVSSPSSARA